MSCREILWQLLAVSTFLPWQWWVLGGWSPNRDLWLLFLCGCMCDALRCFFELEVVMMWFWLVFDCIFLCDRSYFCCDFCFCFLKGSALSVGFAALWLHPILLLPILECMVFRMRCMVVLLSLEEGLSRDWSTAGRTQKVLEADCFFSPSSWEIFFQMVSEEVWLDSCSSRFTCRQQSVLVRA